MTARPRKSAKRPWPKSTVIAGLEAAAFKKGYEAALRKVWAEVRLYPALGEVMTGKGPEWKFTDWRSWFMPIRWPKRGER